MSKCLVGKSLIFIYIHILSYFSITYIFLLRQIKLVHNSFLLYFLVLLTNWILFVQIYVRAFTAILHRSLFLVILSSVLKVFSIFLKINSCLYCSSSCALWSSSFALSCCMSAGVHHRPIFVCLLVFILNIWSNNLHPLHLISKLMMSSFPVIHVVIVFIRIIR